LIDHGPILRALRDGAVYLAGLSLPADAPPAFLLDWRRMSRPEPLRPGMLDNRWRVLPDDLPSGRLLRERGVSRVVLVQRDLVLPQEDVQVILRSWHGGGITLEAKYLSVPGPPRPFRLPRLPWYLAWVQAVLSAVSRRRGPREGFCHVVPAPSHG
jgi:hypothetical protein